MLVVYGDVPQLLVMGRMVYGDVHCVIVDGDDDSGVDDSCQTFSPNCAVKLPMSPSIRGRPVHVFAEDCLLISSYIFSKELLLFLAQLFSYLFQKCIPGFWAWLANS